MEIKYLPIQYTDDLPVFSCERFLRTQSSEYGWIGGFENNVLLFALPYIVKKKLFFRAMQFQTATIIIDKNAQIEKEKDFLNGVLKFLGDSKIDFIIQPANNAVFNAFPDACVSCGFGSYIIDLSETEETLWSCVHSKHRNVINNAANNGVIIERGEKYLPAAYSMLKLTMDRSMMWCPTKEEFFAFYEAMKNNVEIFVAFYKNAPQGCAIIPFSRYSAYYMYGGSADKPLLGSMNLLHWEAIKHFKKEGVIRYDFVGARLHPMEGSKMEGLQRFKGRFGGPMKTGYLWKYIIKPNKYRIYTFLQAIKNKNISMDIIDQEKARNHVDI